MKVRNYYELRDSYIVNYTFLNYRHFKREDNFNVSSYFNFFDYLQEVEKELFDKYLNKTSTTLVIRLREWNYLFRKYFKKARLNFDEKALYGLFKIWDEGRYYFKAYKKRFILNEYLYFSREATDEEKRIASLNKDSIYDVNNLRILTYRNINAFIDKWESANIVDMYGNTIKSFSLDWDWWFPIDYYLDISRYRNLFQELLSEN